MNNKLTEGNKNANALSPFEAVVLSGEGLTMRDFVAISQFHAEVRLSSESMQRVKQARKCVDDRVASGGTFYGINTGFGALANVQIPIEKIAELQLNLIRSHACGVGAPLPESVVRGVLVLRLQTMLRGNSGISPEALLLIQNFLNMNITPVVPSQGSVGACGDLAPLAHIALALIGEGEVTFEGEVHTTLAVLKKRDLAPFVPAAKDGLCLINGTQVMTALGLLCCQNASHLLLSADITASMTLDGVRGTATSLRPEIHASRPYRGQQESAENMRNFLEDDSIRLSHAGCVKVQDPYSIRCAPQVHGASRNALQHVEQMLLIEANSSTDNPLVFAEVNEILSGGNFHGQPAALVLDYLAIAMAEIGSISERRIEKLTNPHMSGLPPFLAHNSGLNSGFMIPHVVAASLVSENKIYAHPASVDSIPTSAEQEDHVSMGMTAALKLSKIITNVSNILAIEAIAAAQALEFHKPLEGGTGVRAAYAFVRKHSAALDIDRSLAKDIAILAEEIAHGRFAEAVTKDLV